MSANIPRRGGRNRAVHAMCGCATANQRIPNQGIARILLADDDPPPDLRSVGEGDVPGRLPPPEMLDEKPDSLHEPPPYLRKRDFPPPNVTGAAVELSPSAVGALDPNRPAALF